LPTSTTPAATPRFDGVDLLRGLSILVVILLHINIHMPTSASTIRTQLPRWLYHLLFLNGDNGVTLFFAISGFLITLTSIRRFGSLAAMRPATFYRIRFARIAPLLLLLLAVLSVLHLANVDGFRISPRVATLPQALFAALTFHINVLEAHARAYLPANWDVLWSLSVEETFYLAFPLLCVLLYRKPSTRPLFLAVLLAFAAIGPYARAVLARGNPIWGDSSYLGGMDAIALGCLCALLTNRLLPGVPHDQRADASRSLIVGSLSSRRLLALQLLGYALILWIFLWPRFHWMRFLGRTALDGTVLPIGACFIIAATVLRENALRGAIASRLTAPLRWFGRHSYELYLTHSFFVITATNLYKRLHPIPDAATSSLLTYALWTIAILLLSAALAALTARYFSEPMNRHLRGAAPPHH
jgi:peptidoglycan/LPS O-acetylase OafA/YrhL